VSRRLQAAAKGNATVRRASGAPRLGRREIERSTARPFVWAFIARGRGLMPPLQPTRSSHASVRPSGALGRLDCRVACSTLPAEPPERRLYMRIQAGPRRAIFR